MFELVAGGLALWALAIVAVLAVCRAAARADDRGQQLVRAGRRGATVSLAAAAVALPAAPEASAKEACANRHVQFEAAPSLVRDALACEIDRVRTRRDARRLRGDPQLERAAARHAADMVGRRYFSHSSPGGADLADRARRAGYALRRCRWRVGEVLAWGVGRRSTATRIVRAWMRSPPHRRVLLSRRYRELGIGMEAGTPESSGGVTVAALLGRRHC